MVPVKEVQRPVHPPAWGQGELQGRSHTHTGGNHPCSHLRLGTIPLGQWLLLQMTHIATNSHNTWLQPEQRSDLCESELHGQACTPRTFS